MSGSLSVIVPIGPAETEFKDIVDQLRRMDGVSEVILSVTEEFALNNELSGSSDPETEIASLRVVQGTAGRAQQLNRAAQQAQSEYLWFVHIDSSFRQTDCARVLLQKLKKFPQSVFYFDLRFADGTILMRLTEFGVFWRCRLMNIPFGDQALALSAELFSSIGPYDEELRYGEDHVLCWRAQQQGFQVRPVGRQVFTSARKYLNNGWWKTTSQHVLLTFRQAWPELRKLYRF